MAAPSSAELLSVLEAVAEQEGVDAFVRPEGMEQERSMYVVNELLDRRWVSAQAQNAGDGRLISVRGLRPTPSGRSALTELRREAVRNAAVTGNPLSLQEKKRRRAALMATLYEFSDGLELKSLSADELALRLEWSVEDTNAALEYLEHEGLVTFLAMGPQVGITHHGVIEVEYAMEHPDEPTEHFLPHTVIVVQGDMVESQIQAANVGSQQTQHIAIVNEREIIEEFVAAFRDVLLKSELLADERAIAEAELATVEAQLSSPKPNDGVLREALRSLRSIAEGIAANGAFVGLIALAAKLHL